MKKFLMLLSLAAVGLADPVAAAKVFHRARHIASRADHAGSYKERVIHASQEPLGSGGHNPYTNYHGPGSAVLNATERARNEPGVTLELAPDAKETATGGPVGGPPGFDGS